MPRKSIIPCSRQSGWGEVITSYAESLRLAAHSIGDHGLSLEEFEKSGLFQSAVERLRGQRAASTKDKYTFVETILEYLKSNNFIEDYWQSGNNDRHDFEVRLLDDRLCVIEAKGCLDGNNTNIFVRPPNADEFVVWSLCQNAGSDPNRNVWSGIHTRLSPEIISRPVLVDGVIIWDALCGNLRPCPKLNESPERATKIGDKSIPPPCIYLLPRTIPHPRNNPNPTPWKLTEVKFLDTLAKAFGTYMSEVVSVSIETRMQENNVQRRTVYQVDGSEISRSRWTSIRRAN